MFNISTRKRRWCPFHKIHAFLISSNRCPIKERNGKICTSRSYSKLSELSNWLSAKLNFIFPDWRHHYTGITRVLITYWWHCRMTWLKIWAGWLRMSWVAFRCVLQTSHYGWLIPNHHINSWAHAAVGALWTVCTAQHQAL